MPGSLKIKRIDHVAVCVADIDGALARWKALLGVDPVAREIVESQKTEAALLPIGETSLELIAPRGNDSLSRFLDKRGPGLHHVAIEVEGIDQALALLKSLGVPLIDETARTGARGHKVAFIHPKATGGVLVELVEPGPAVAERVAPGSAVAERVAPGPAVAERVEPRPGVVAGPSERL
jgi:methylmalonyl-CoA/ethylmalonyl-CoA epimerase